MPQDEVWYDTRVDGNTVRDQAVILGGIRRLFHLGKYGPASKSLAYALYLGQLSGRHVFGRFCFFDIPRRKSGDKKIVVKTFATFIPATTHAVASKRNMAIGFLALDLSVL